MRQRGAGIITFAQVQHRRLKMAFEEELPDATTWEDAHKGKRKYKVLASIADFMEGGKQLGFCRGGSWI